MGSCSACHSRHDFSPRRARQPENCGKCHLGPDHPQKEIYEESKHGVAFRDLIGEMNLDAKPWVVGKDYSAAPTCATCHMSANMRNGMKITHDPGERISWTNRPPVSLVMDTDVNGAIVTAIDPAERQLLITDTADAKRTRMKEVCSHCHTPDYVNGFYRQYDDLVILYNEKFAKPGKAIIVESAKANAKVRSAHMWVFMVAPSASVGKQEKVTRGQSADCLVEFGIRPDLGACDRAADQHRRRGRG